MSQFLHVDLGTSQFYESLPSLSTPSLPPSQSPAVSGVPVVPSSGIQSPAAVHVAGGPGVGGMLEEDEHGISICLFVYTIF